MYAGDSRTPSAAIAEGSGINATQGESLGEPGTAVEVIELANGETIWRVENCSFIQLDYLLKIIRSIVNGLRDDDAESFYDNRASFASEYSGEGGFRVFFKEHGRKGSKGSNTSLLSRKKHQASTSQRPETKVRALQY